MNTLSGSVSVSGSGKYKSMVTLENRPLLHSQASTQASTQASNFKDAAAAAARSVHTLTSTDKLNVDGAVNSDQFQKKETLY